ncbi:MAG: hypothetical protein AAF702_01480 [Chloroflexota bacterium]
MSVRNILVLPIIVLSMIMPSGSVLAQAKTVNHPIITEISENELSLYQNVLSPDQIIRDESWSSRICGSSSVSIITFKSDRKAQPGKMAFQSLSIISTSLTKQLLTDGGNNLKIVESEISPSGVILCVSDRLALNIVEVVLKEPGNDAFVYIFGKTEYATKSKDFLDWAKTLKEVVNGVVDYGHLAYQGTQYIAGWLIDCVWLASTNTSLCDGTDRQPESIARDTSELYVQFHYKGWLRNLHLTYLTDEAVKFQEELEEKEPVVHDGGNDITILDNECSGFVEDPDCKQEDIPSSPQEVAANNNQVRQQTPIQSPSQNQLQQPNQEQPHTSIDLPGNCVFSTDAFKETGSSDEIVRLAFSEEEQVINVKKRLNDRKFEAWNCTGIPDGYHLQFDVYRSQKNYERNQSYYNNPNNPSGCDGCSGTIAKFKLIRLLQNVAEVVPTNSQSLENEDSEEIITPQQQITSAEVPFSPQTQNAIPTNQSTQTQLTVEQPNVPIESTTIGCVDATHPAMIINGDSDKNSGPCYLLVEGTNTGFGDLDLPNQECIKIEVMSGWTIEVHDESPYYATRVGPNSNQVCKLVGKMRILVYRSSGQTSPVKSVPTVSAPNDNLPNIHAGTNRSVAQFGFDNYPFCLQKGLDWNICWKEGTYHGSTAGNYNQVGDSLRFVLWPGCRVHIMTGRGKEYDIRATNYAVPIKGSRFFAEAINVTCN